MTLMFIPYHLRSSVPSLLLRPAYPASFVPEGDNSFCISDKRFFPFPVYLFSSSHDTMAQGIFFFPPGSGIVPWLDKQVCNRRLQTLQTTGLQSHCCHFE